MPTAIPEIVIPNVFVVPTTEYGWNVILWNDNTVSAEVVIEALQTELGYDEIKAGAIMWEAHTDNKASVIVTHKTLAEHYRERLQSYGLTITIEKV
jgi:ATP-dependent Clp protease adapter protein ClpS